MGMLKAVGSYVYPVFTPPTYWPKGYLKSPTFVSDVLAGLTISFFVIPQGLSYALVAELPPQYGLYGAVIGPAVYALFGRSGQLNVAASAILSLLVAESLAHEIPPEIFDDSGHHMANPAYINAAVCVALVSGLIQLALASMKVGKVLSTLLSHVLITSFTSAAAILIVILQFKSIFQVDVPRGGLHESLGGLIDNIKDVNVASLLLSIGCMVSLFLWKKYFRVFKRVPIQLVVVVVATMIVKLGNLDHPDHGNINTIGNVPSSMPSPSFPVSPFSYSSGISGKIISASATIAIISFVESLSIAQIYAAKPECNVNNIEIVPNQELFAVGVTNVVASLFSAFPVTGGFSRSAVHASAGAKTPLAGVFGAILVLVCLMVLTPMFKFIPKSALASIVLVAATSLIDLDTLKHLYQTRATQGNDLLVWIATFAVTLFLGVEAGIIVGVAINLLGVVTRLARVQLVVLGLYKNTTQFRQLKRKPWETVFVPGIHITRFEGDILFVNQKAFTTELFKTLAKRQEEEEASRSGQKIYHVIIDFSGVMFVDTDGIHALEKVAAKLKEGKKQEAGVVVKPEGSEVGEEDDDCTGIKLLLSNCKANVRDILKEGLNIKPSQKMTVLMDGHDLESGAGIGEEEKKEELMEHEPILCRANFFETTMDAVKFAEGEMEIRSASGGSQVVIGGVQEVGDAAL